MIWVLSSWKRLHIDQRNFASSGPFTIGFLFRAASIFVLKRGEVHRSTVFVSWYCSRSQVGGICLIHESLFKIIKPYSFYLRDSR